MAPDESVTAETFAARSTVEQVEEGTLLSPKFAPDGLLPAFLAMGR